MSETIYKLQPNRTIYMRGFDGFGAAAAITNATATGLTVSGVFRAMDDFAVIVLFDADNNYEHQSIAYLPDFNFSGITWGFDYVSTNCQPIDSRFSSWIDWGKLDLITAAGEPLQIPLFANATLKNASDPLFTVASGSVTISGSPATGNFFTLFINNVPFQFDTSEAYDGAAACSSLAYAVNTYDWSRFASASVAVMASFAAGSGSSGTLTLTNAQTGRVNVSGTAVTWLSGDTFQAVYSGDNLILGGSTYTVATVSGPGSLTLTASAGTLSNVFYLSPRRGVDGNSITAYIVDDGSNYSFSSTVIPFSGGNSDGVAWAVLIDFDAAIGIPVGGGTGQAINSLRQIALTFAPQLPVGQAYPPGGATGVNWSVGISGWTVTDTLGHRALSVAGPGTVRVGNGDSWVKYSGSWSLVSANNYYLGFARVSNTTGDTITISYSSNFTHDLYIGCELYVDRGIVNISLDGDSATAFDSFLNVSTPIMGRRKVRSGVAAGTHSVVITLTGTNHVAAGSWDINSLGYYFLFNFIEAVVASDVPDPSVTYSNVTAALDYDTGATYQMPPARLVWALQKMGLLGQANLYLGVYWWNQRKAVGLVNNSITISFSSFGSATAAKLYLDGFAMLKAIASGDTDATIAAHFAYYINCAAVAFWASASGPNLTITQFAPTSPAYTATSITAQWYASGAYSTFYSGSIGVGTVANWDIDDSASPVLNVAASAWLTDFCETLAAASMSCSIAVSMELVNPPAGYAAEFADGTPATTATDFDGLFSTQTAIGNSSVLALQKAAFLEIAGIQNAAGLPVYLQEGEWLWWYEPEHQSVAVGFVANTYPASIGITSHGMSTGQSVVISGALDASGNASAINGTWPVTLVDARSLHDSGSGWNVDAGDGICQLRRHGLL